MPIRLVALTQATRKKRKAPGPYVLVVEEAEPVTAARAMPEKPARVIPEPPAELPVVEEFNWWQRFKVWVKELLHVSR
jgi:hypothetical protein